MNVRRGDTVVILAGKDRGKRGTVDRLEKTKRGFGVVIPGINMAKRHQRAPRGANREAVLRAAAERPGATSSELAAVSGAEPKTLSGLLARLVKTGELQSVRCLPERTGYALADTPRAQAGGARSGGAAGGADAINDTSRPDRT